jgi:hypothetical protein
MEERASIGKLSKLIPIRKNNVVFERVKASRFDDRKLGCIGLILPNLRSSNPDSFDAAEMQRYFCGLV